MSKRPPAPALFTRGLSSLSQSSNPDSPNVGSPAETRDDAKRNMLKAMRALPIQNVWEVWFDRPPSKDANNNSNNNINNNNTSNSTITVTTPTSSTTTAAAADHDANYQAQLIAIQDTKIMDVQTFWKYSNNFPPDRLKMRDSLYLFKQGYRPVWEDRRNVLGGSWTFRMPKGIGPDVWTRVQLLAIGETLEAALEEGDQICGVGLSVRFNSHLISIWHRDAAKKKSVDGLLACVLEQLPEELRPKPDNYFYKRHADHPGFNPSPELRAVLDSHRKREAAASLPVGVSPAQEKQEEKEKKVEADKQGKQNEEKTQQEVEKAAQDT